MDVSTAEPAATQIAAIDGVVPVIAIPVRNEEGLIGACLTAIGQQAHAPRPHVVLLLNNTTDRTAWVAREAAAGQPMTLTILEHSFPLPEQTAGHARRLAMQHAASRAQPGGVLLCTDADGRVAPDWLAANLFHIRHGADAVAGRVLLDATDAAAIPAALHEADAREVAYATVLDRIACLLDPDPADPWPRHTEHSGASICVTSGAYHRCGGIPAVSLGEDRAFFAALRGIDARIRHAPDVVVTVSGRVFGRARGGMADTIRRRLTALDPFIDDALEPALDRVRRLRLRRRMRSAQLDGNLVPDIAAELCWPVRRIEAALALPSFGAAWAALEESCTALAPRPVATDALEAEMAVAVRLCDGLLRAAPPGEVLEAAD